MVLGLAAVGGCKCRGDEVHARLSPEGQDRLVAANYRVGMSIDEVREVSTILGLRTMAELYPAIARHREALSETADDDGYIVAAAGPAPTSTVSYPLYRNGCELVIPLVRNRPDPSDALLEFRFEQIETREVLKMVRWHDQAGNAGTESLRVLSLPPSSGEISEGAER